MMDSDAMQVRGGGQFTSRPHLVTPDGKSILVCHGNTVRAHSALTGQPMYKLVGHTDAVTAVAQDVDLPRMVGVVHFVDVY